MQPTGVPQIFSLARRRRRGQRAATRRLRSENCARFLAEEIGTDMADRLAFVRADPDKLLLIGQIGGAIRSQFPSKPITYGHALDLEKPYDLGNLTDQFDFVGIGGQLDAVNDLPGALIHARNALTPGGLVIASFVGGASLPRLRAAMMAAEPDRPAARIHPLVDPRAAPGLLQRAGWKDPVVDTYTLNVRYSSLDRLVSDLRDQAQGNAFAEPATPLGQAALQRAREAFLDGADADGKVTETFEIITLTGRRSLAGT
ncbi:methyltransferase [Qipengyuania sp. DSG2-2]|uniref:methyltransferase n=1 Tax=Qipengyuania sp. DGS2-2 TaxID=3349631 RepID=UPI0036D42A2B